MDHAILTATLGLILQHRSLMPMCVTCAIQRQKELSLPFKAEFRSSIDSCSCAAFVFDDKICQWCAVEQLCKRRNDYINMHMKMPECYDGTRALFLQCECGQDVMGWATDAAPHSPLVREVLRVCSGCSGVVNVPLHHLDGKTHLACIPGRWSQALVGAEGLVAASVEGEPLGLDTNEDEKCIAHPVRTISQRIISSRKLRTVSAVRMPTSGGFQGGISDPGQRAISPQASTGVWPTQPMVGGMGPQSQASMGMTMQQQVFGGMPSQPAREMENRPPAFGAIRNTQQRQAPMALMVPATPEEQWEEEDTSKRGQLNPGFRFPQ